MFSSSPQDFPLRSRLWGIALGSLILVAATAVVVSAKTIQASLPALLIAALAAAVARRQLKYAKLHLDGVTLSLLAFIFYAGLSALWAPEPQATALIALMAALIALGSLALFQLMQSERYENALHMGEGLWIGLAVGLLYVLCEIASDQAIKIWVYNALTLTPEMLEPARFFTWEGDRIVAIHSDDLTRNAAPIPLLIWPALMAAGALPPPVWRPLVSGCLLLLSATAVLLGPNETAKLALLAGFAVYALARHLPRAIRYGVAGAWIVACLGVAPLAALAHHLGLQNANWLQLSAQIRVIMWNEIAALIPNAPLFGVGAGMTYVIRPVMHEFPPGEPHWLGFPITHPHNLYLQTWYELGVIGAILLTVFGLVLLRRIAGLSTIVQPFALAMFASAAVLVGSSYGMWQIWFLCLFGFAAAMYGLGQGLLQQHIAAFRYS